MYRRATMHRYLHVARNQQPFRQRYFVAMACVVVAAAKNSAGKLRIKLFAAAVKHVDDEVEVAQQVLGHGLVGGV